MKWRTSVSQRISEPGPGNFIKKVISYNIRFHWRTHEGDHAKGAVPSVLTLWIMQHNKAADSQLFIIRINGLNS